MSDRMRGIALAGVFWAFVAVSMHLDKGFHGVVYANVLGDIWNVLTWLASNTGSFLKSLLTGVAYVLGQLFGILLHGILTVVMGILNGLDLGNVLTTSAGAWAGLDPSIAWFINACGISQGLTMIGTAYVTRFVLNLIPASFTRI